MTDECRLRQSPAQPRARDHPPAPPGRQLQQHDYVLALQTPTFHVSEHETQRSLRAASISRWSPSRLAYMHAAVVMPSSPPPCDPHTYAQLLLRKARSHRVVLDHVAPDPAFADMIVGFHTQQAIEKLIKAVLSHHPDRLPPRQRPRPPAPPTRSRRDHPAARRAAAGKPHALGNPAPLRRPARGDQPRPAGNRHTGRRHGRLGINPNSKERRRCPEPEQLAGGPTTFGVVPLRS